MLGYVVQVAFSVGVLLALLTAPPVWSQSCQNLFRQNEIHESKFQLSQKQSSMPALVNVAPLESTMAVNDVFKKLLQSAADLKFLPIGSRFAVHLSRQNHIHLVSEGLTDKQHLQLLTFLQVSHTEQILLGVPMLFRNRYFEVEVQSHGPRTIKAEVTPKLAWDLKVPVKSQVITGFASVATDKIRPFDPATKNPAEKIRKELFDPRFTQETFATCGLASLIKVFKPRQIKYTELELLKIVESSGIREIQQIFSSDPGLTLSQAAKLLQILGRQHGFTVTEVKVTSDEDVAEFAKVAALASEGKNTDVIVNYYSPFVGRPGGGHFTPIAGYNPKTKEVLLGEVNLAMNPSFWTHQKTMVDAMNSQSPTDPIRGYLVINWLDPLKQ